jgi:hypothetical protein
MCKAVHAGARAGHWRFQQRQDVTGAWLYLSGRPDVIPDRIGLWGGSYSRVESGRVGDQLPKVGVAGFVFGGIDYVVLSYVG